MEQQKHKVYYSIIRYTADEIRNETLNVGALLYCYNERAIRLNILDENSSKLKAILDTKVDLLKYKTNKEVLEFYLNNNKQLLGDVGSINIASYHDENFMDKIFEKKLSDELFLSKPNFAYTKDIDSFFNSILKRYVGERHIIKEDSITVSAKKYMRNIFEHEKLLGTKVKSDIILNPIENLDDLKIKIDFTFKNDVWNYMQTIPKISNSNKNTEWFAKIQLMLNSLKSEDAKIHLLYKSSDIQDDTETNNLINYLKSNSNNKIITLNIDKKNEVSELCEYINKKAQLLDTAI
jgi:hypothetical protein